MVNAHKILEDIATHGWSHLSKKVGLHCFGELEHIESEGLHCFITLKGNPRELEYDSQQNGKPVARDDDTVLLQTEVLISPSTQHTKVIQEQQDHIIHSTHEYNKIIPDFLVKLYGVPLETVMINNTPDATITQMREFKKYLGGQIPEWTKLLRNSYLNNQWNFYSEYFDAAQEQVPDESSQSSTIDFQLQSYGGKTTSHSQYQEVHLNITKKTPKTNYSTKEIKWQSFVIEPLASIQFHYNGNGTWIPELVNQSSAQDMSIISDFYPTILRDLGSYMPLQSHGQGHKPFK